MSPESHKNRVEVKSCDEWNCILGPRDGFSNKYFNERLLLRVIPKLVADVPPPPKRVDGDKTRADRKGNLVKGCSSSF